MPSRESPSVLVKLADTRLILNFTWDFVNLAVAIILQQIRKPRFGKQLESSWVKSDKNLIGNFVLNYHQLSKLPRRFQSVNSQSVTEAPSALMMYTDFPSLDQSASETNGLPLGFGFFLL